MAFCCRRGSTEKPVYDNEMKPQGEYHYSSISDLDEKPRRMQQFLEWGVGVERSESMDVQNDPRFTASNVMDKRLGAFKSLTLVSGLMFGTSMKECFAVHKDINFAEYNEYVGYIGYWELMNFIIAFIVAAMCLISLYVISHQLFFCMRLKTAGVMGYEQATIFYLTRCITLWRHFAMSCLFNGLWMFMVLIGVELFVDFYKDSTDKFPVRDANGDNKGVTKLWVTNVINGNSINNSSAFIAMHKHHKLDMMVHTVLGYVILFFFGLVCLMLHFIHKQHVDVFKLNYKASKALSDPITNRVTDMGTRAGLSLVQG